MRVLKRAIFRLIALPPRLLYAVGLGGLVGKRVLVLTTTGRVSGRFHTTPLQYEPVDGTFVVGSARGTGADWFRNVVAHPSVTVQVGRSRYTAVAEPCVEPAVIADFLELRRRRHPWFMRAVMSLRAGTWAPERADLEAYASRIAIVTINPLAMQPAQEVARGKRPAARLQPARNPLEAP